MSDTATTVRAYLASLYQTLAELDISNPSFLVPAAVALNVLPALGLPHPRIVPAKITVANSAAMRRITGTHQADDTEEPWMCESQTTNELTNDGWGGYAVTYLPAAHPKDTPLLIDPTFSQYTHPHAPRTIAAQIVPTSEAFLRPNGTTIAGMPDGSVICWEHKPELDGYRELLARQQDAIDQLTQIVLGRLPLATSEPKP